MSEELTERDGTILPGYGGFGDLPEDLRGSGPVSIPGVPYVFEGDAYAYGGGSYRTYVEPIPSVASDIKFTAISYLPRFNFESFRSQRFFQFGRASIAPSTGNTFTTLATITIPQGVAGVVTGLGQWIGDATAYQKADGSADDVAWQISVSGTGAFGYANFSLIISTLEQESKLFLIASENTVITLSATNNQTVAGFGTHDIPVTGYITGHQFPIDELDDIFRNR